MAATKTYKRNDSGPPIVIQCLDGSNPQDLTNATSAKFLMGTVNASGVASIKTQGAMTFDADRTTGKVTYDWLAGDLDTVGDYKVEVEITWNSGEKQTFPAAGYLTVSVVADIG